MARRNPNRRSAFTLLEMMLALAIGVMLMSGLYFALSVQVAATNSGRGQVDQAQVARNVLDLVTHDIKSGLATLDAYATGAPAATTTTATAAPVVNTFAFNLGVQGESDWCAIFCSKVPKAIAQSQASDNQMSGGDVQAMDTDLRRITYYLVPASDGKGGLVRQELINVTSADASASTLPPSGIDEFSAILAEEVLAVAFEYWDGSGWQTSWSGQSPSAGAYMDSSGNMVGPTVGPPLSIKITISVARSDNLKAELTDPSVRQYVHVIQIPTASFFNNQQPGG